MLLHGTSANVYADLRIFNFPQDFLEGVKACAEKTVLSTTYAMKYHAILLIITSQPKVRPHLDLNLSKNKNLEYHFHENKYKKSKKEVLNR